MNKRCVYFGILFFLLFATLVFAQTHFQPELDTIYSNLDLAEEKLLDNKITELRNLIWEDVDPMLKGITDNIENNIQTMSYIGIYDLDEINLSYGDIKRGMAMFEKTKIDVNYAINEMDFEKKIYEERDIVEELRKISYLLPEIEVTYSKKNEVYNITEKDIDSFALNIKDIEMFTSLKKMNLTFVNSNIEFKEDEISYTYTNYDESNKSILVKSINKKIRASNTVENIQIYEIFPEEILISDINFRTTHEPDVKKNAVLLYSGTFFEDRTIPVYFIIKTNLSSKDVSKTLVVLESLDSSKQKNDFEIINQSFKKIEPIKFEDIEIIEKENYVPYIILFILICVFLMLVLGSLIIKDKLARDLEKYRKRINNLKGNV